MTCSFLWLNSDQAEVIVLGPKQLRSKLINDIATLDGFTPASTTQWEPYGILTVSNLSSIFIPPKVKGTKEEEEDQKKNRKWRQVAAAAKMMSSSFFCLKKRTFWVHLILRRRPEHGEFYHLIQELRLYHGRFRQYFRLTVEQFEALLGMLVPYIHRQYTNYHQPVSPEQRLAMCLRWAFYLTGMIVLC